MLKNYTDIPWFQCRFILLPCVIQCSFKLDLWKCTGKEEAPGMSQAVRNPKQGCKWKQLLFFSQFAVLKLHLFRKCRVSWRHLKQPLSDFLFHKEMHHVKSSKTICTWSPPSVGLIQGSKLVKCVLVSISEDSLCFQSRFWLLSFLILICFCVCFVGMTVSLRMTVIVWRGKKQKKLYCSGVISQNAPWLQTVMERYIDY